MKTLLKWLLIVVQCTVTSLTALLSVATVPLLVLMVWTVIMYFDAINSYGGDGWMAALVATSTLSLASVAATETGFFWLLKFWDIIPRKSATLGIKIFGIITIIAILFFLFVMAIYFS